MSNKKSARKPEVRPQKPAVEVLSAEKVASATSYDTALARFNAMMVSTTGTCRGVIPTQRATHASALQGLMSKDQAIRQQILQLKAKENEVLAKIRDRVAANLLETMDTAIEEGVLDAPDEV